MFFLLGYGKGIFLSAVHMVEGVVALLLLVAVVTAVYKEYRVERSGTRKVVGILLAFIIFNKEKVVLEKNVDSEK